MTEAQKILLGQKSLKELKKIAWDVFSEWVRKRNVDQRGYVACVSCGQVRHWQDQMTAGHWPTLAGRSNAVLFLEDGVWPQCVQCNVFKGGNPFGYDIFMNKKFSKKRLNEMRRLKQKSVKYEKVDLIRMIGGWAEELDLLK